MLTGFHAHAHLETRAPIADAVGCCCQMCVSQLLMQRILCSVGQGGNEEFQRQMEAMDSGSRTNAAEFREGRDAPLGRRADRRCLVRLLSSPSSVPWH